MVYLVDTIQVEPKNADKYLRLVEKIGVPAMKGAGVNFVSCWATSKELGEDVSIKVIWSFKDHVEWNDLRKNLVLSPQWHEYAEKGASLRKGGTRRFYYPAAFSPLK
jgi:hypothetical protein